jgi:hypothetical protein
LSANPEPSSQPKAIETLSLLPPVLSIVVHVEGLVRNPIGFEDFVIRDNCIDQYIIKLLLFFSKELLHS